MFEFITKISLKCEVKDIIWQPNPIKMGIIHMDESAEKSNVEIAFASVLQLTYLIFSRVDIFCNRKLFQ